ncbi:DNA polymerase gamma [Smittium culicis]|uniref:Mitochondrial DNA polymerase catalytic subunit n=1 Tax=Smittium culicis TaxID=133412 RepID=A0A1R1XKA2_9FUNG|nr:DNA polymerase gamma [Smittium culicis]
MIKINSRNTHAFSCRNTAKLKSKYNFNLKIRFIQTVSQFVNNPFIHSSSLKNEIHNCKFSFAQKFKNISYQYNCHNYFVNSYSTYIDVNEIGVQLLPEDIHYEVFGKNISKIAESFGKTSEKNANDESKSPQSSSETHSNIVNLSKEHLKRQGLFNEGQAPVYNELYAKLNIKNSSIQAKNIRDHFKKISLDTYSDYLSLAKAFVSSDKPAQIPSSEIIIKSGWVRYVFDQNSNTYSHESVIGIKEDALVFDIENLTTLSPYPLLASAVTSEATYLWISPYITGESNSPNHLIKISEPSSKKAKIIIGHNISYDRARIFEEYSYTSTLNRFIDTMSLHIATSGLCSQQRPIYNKVSKILKDENYSPENSIFISKFGKMASVSSTNGLKAAVKFHNNIDLDKDIRDTFVTGCISDIRENILPLIDYCTNDVLATLDLYKTLFPKYLKLCPHPASFAGMLIMTNSFLPIYLPQWESFVNTCEQKSESITKELQDKLVELALLAIECKDPHSDPWLKNLDWTPFKIKTTKAKVNKYGKILPGGEPKLFKNFKKYSKDELDFLTGKPKWFTDCYDFESKKIIITFKQQLTPYLLKLTWLNYPLYYSKNFGWTFVVPRSQLDKVDLLSKNNSSLADLSGLNESSEDDIFRSNLILIAKMPILKFTSEIENKNYEPIPASDTENYYFRIPHKDGENANCGNPLSKNYLSSIENNVLGSSFEISKEAIQMNTLTSYWVSVRKRVIGQFVVPMNDKLKSEHTSSIKSDHLGMILPQLVPMGTITRRGVEPTWATASNAKKNRIGSEIKTLIRSPTICSTETGQKQSFKVVGADVDSEELWISSLMGDAQFGSHGSTALGYMTLLGTKSQGNDMHSATAKILGIDRNNAKVFNYSRIYGAGVKHATQLLCQYNSNITQPDALKLAKNLYLKTKGVKMNSMGFESEFFSLKENDPNSEKEKGSLNQAPELQEKNINNVDTKPKKRQFWAGGSESYMFNSLEDVALSDDPRTPVLKCGIVDGLQAKSAGESVSRI